MPFDPKLIQPDDAPLRADGDLDLPGDLARLAEQLSDDAACLASRYPASACGDAVLAAELVESAKRIKSASRRRMISAVGAGLAAVAGLAALVAFAPSLFQQSSSDRADALPLAGRPSFRTAAAPIVVPVVESTSLPVRPPSLSLGELSGPEMEALFDLLQHDPRRAGSISF